MKECASLGIKQIFTSFNNPKGNADTERMMRTMKEELIWSNEFESFEQLSLALEAWVKDYNWHNPYGSDDRNYHYVNKITKEQRPITEEQYNDNNYTLNT